MPFPLEAVDTRILGALQNDGRLTNQALSAEVGLSTSPCWRRVRQLEESGVIQSYTAVLDRRQIGLGVLAFIRVKIDSHSEAEAEEFSQDVLKLSEVVACYSIAGDADFLLQVVAADLDGYADFAMRVVRRLPRIKEMQTTFVLKEIKPFRGFPLDVAGR
ncbi:Lrp/AsnC family transcriptional regulator [Agrobacterium sp. SHOUNA12C]|uniref:Transcriptional regulator protein n=2 Tax=Rhizobium rhizogenes TaxID=359 RepID=B9JA84_RHIR8|nr:Lrp/AsnC family transcriptional regulator [Rhizobium rhizogenes]ACM27699.1 transcriptional regulator protein [Rhizobium rhizogenes K84]KAA6484476.1 Lrp/AsnC family transcriptional regulator [Agrobacterium sp. ICMP 7243]MCJ9724811.1 Lrp/AsnC family transcriptional regulator [Agrobacterium sp. BETTINA12B]MCJ9760484.1 Lrp/AsnC family transcriptional regulator [Agrobacterium sp. SHOUNA12C]OCI92147.1 AsnC family transcriptional regulator [Agrobacterium sp. 13-626]OCJ13757.1 AsnC family transcri